MQKKELTIANHGDLINLNKQDFCQNLITNIIMVNIQIKKKIRKYFVKIKYF